MPSQKVTIGIGIMLFLFGVLLFIRTLMPIPVGVYGLVAAIGFFYTYYFYKPSGVFLVSAWAIVAISCILLTNEVAKGRFSQYTFSMAVWPCLSVAALGLHVTGYRKVGHWPAYLGIIFLAAALLTMVWEIRALYVWWLAYGRYILSGLFVLAGMGIIGFAVIGGKKQAEHVQATSTGQQPFQASAAMGDLQPEPKAQMSDAPFGSGDGHASVYPYNGTSPTEAHKTPETSQASETLLEETSVSTNATVLGASFSPESPMDEVAVFDDGTIQIDLELTPPSGDGQGTLGQDLYTPASDYGTVDIQEINTASATNPSSDPL